MSAAGWYPHPEMPEPALWDGEKFTDPAELLEEMLDGLSLTRMSIAAQRCAERAPSQIKRKYRRARIRMMLGR